MMGFSPERGGREDTGREALARELADLFDPYERCVTDLMERRSQATFQEHLKLLTDEYDAVLVRLRETFGERLLVDEVLANREIRRGFPFEISIDSIRLARHFEDSTRRTFAELFRVGVVCKAEAFALDLLKGEAQSWPTLGFYHELRSLVGLLAYRFSRQPLVFADALRWGAVLLERAHNEHAAAGEKASVVANEDLLISTLKEAGDFSLSTLSYLLRRRWEDRGSKPVRTLCELIQTSAAVGHRGVEELFRNSLERSVLPSERREIAKFLAGDERRIEILLDRTLDPFLRAAVTLDDPDFDYVSEHLRVVCSGISNPNLYSGRILLDRGAHFLLQGERPDGPNIMTALRRCHDLYPSIPSRLLMVVIGQIDGDETGLQMFDRVCGFIEQMEPEPRDAAWEALRRGVLSFGHYKDSRLINVLRVGGVHTKEHALIFSHYMRESDLLSTIASRHGMVLPEVTCNWNQNLRELREWAPQLWSRAISTAYPDSAGTGIGQPSSGGHRVGGLTRSFAARQFNASFNSHLVPFYEYAYLHWQEASIQHSQEMENFIRVLGPAPYTNAKRHRYNPTRPTVAEQLRSLDEAGREFWQADHFGKSVQITQNRATRTFRMLVTDYPAILLRIGDTPVNTDSCLSLSSSPRTNKALLALLQDAHQKVALFLNIEKLPTELRNVSVVNEDLLFRHSEAVRHACVCRSVLKIGERSDGSAVLVQGPEYFPEKKSDRLVTRQFRAEIESYATARLGVPLFGRLIEGGVGEVISMPPSSSSAGQNDDYDGVRWSSCMRGRYQLSLSKR